MQSVAFSEDELPTKQERTSAAILMAGHDIERRAEVAIERLTCAPDHDAVMAAVEDLAEIRRLARTVCR